MLKKISLGILALVAGISGLKAQDNFGCGQHEMTMKYWEQHPEYKEIAKKNEAALSKIDEATIRQFAKSGQHIIIPVVFHVIHDNGPENISDAQIRSAVADMNMRFRKENADTSNVIAAFADIVADVQIEFRLATRTPSGACTDGINRYHDTRTYTAGENVKEGRQWDPARYLNIYTVRRIESGAAGYSYIPGTVGPDGDGIVMLANYTGSMGTSTPNRASTLSHEAGHYLGLYHTWGQSNNPGQAGNCEMDDFVEDTPLTVGNTWCNTNAVSCGSLDNVQNYMEYSGCRHMFTEGQKARIYGFIAQNTAGRQNLTSSQNSIVTGTDYPRDTFPDYLCQANFQVATNAENICPGQPIQFEDKSFFDIVAWNWSFEGGEPATSTLENPVVVYNEPGSFAVSLTVTNSKGETETVTRDDIINVDGSANLGYPVQENFYNPEMFDPAPVGWFTVNNPDEDIFWQLTEPEGYDDDRCVVLAAHGVTSYNNLDEFTSGVINISGSNPVMSFYYAHTFKLAPQNSDRLFIYISEDCGESWSILDTIVDEELETAAARNNYFRPTSTADWKRYEYDMQAYASKSVKVRFSYVHLGGNNIYIDKFEINSLSGIEENERLISSVYPNPLRSGTRLNIETRKQVSKIELRNGLGQVVWKNPSFQSSNKIGITLPKMASGLYYIYAESDQGTDLMPIVIVD